MDYFNIKPISFVDGIKRYTDGDYYWGITPREEIEKFIAIAKESGFKNTLKSFKFNSRFDYAENYRRSDFLYYLPDVRNGVVLDIGSGFGNVTIPLSKFCKKIVAADVSMPLLQFSSLRAKEEGCNNIDYVQINPLEKGALPFSDKQFDVIILNGVLEWVGPFNTDKSPRDLQIDFLKSLKPLLKDDGVLYIGIENRLFPGWLRRDPHSKLPFTVIMPRFIANWYARKKGQSGYRTYIYSKPGYKKILSEAGFVISNFFYAFPSYREPNIIYSSARNVVGYVIKNILNDVYTKKWAIFSRVSFLFNFYGLFLSSFLMMCSKRRVQFLSIFQSLMISRGIKKEDVHYFVKVMTSDDQKTCFKCFNCRMEPTLSVIINRMQSVDNVDVEIIKI